MNYLAKYSIQRNNHTKGKTIIYCFLWSLRMIYWCTLSFRGRARGESAFGMGGGTVKNLIEGIGDSMLIVRRRSFH